MLTSFRKAPCDEELEGSVEVVEELEDDERREDDEREDDGIGSDEDELSNATWIVPSGRSPSGEWLELGSGAACGLRGDVVDGRGPVSEELEVAESELLESGLINRSINSRTEGSGHGSGEARDYATEAGDFPADSTTEPPGKPAPLAAGRRGTTPHGRF